MNVLMITLRLVPVAQEKPDADETVLMLNADWSEPCWPGFFDGGQWRGAEGHLLDQKSGDFQPPTHWTRMPAMQDAKPDPAEAEEQDIALAIARLPLMERDRFYRWSHALMPLLALSGSELAAGISAAAQTLDVAQKTVLRRLWRLRREGRLALINPRHISANSKARANKGS